MRIRLRLGGVALEVRAAHPTPALALARRLAPFVDRSRAPADICLDLVGDPVPVPESDALFDSGGTWRAHGVGRSALLYVFRPPRGDGPPARGLLVDTRRRRGTLFLPPSRWSTARGFALSYPLDELLLQHHLARRDGFVMHACGVELDGGALLFAGVSGAGKTTLARLWAGARARPRARVLSDDRLIVRRRGRGFVAFGTPWHGSGRYAAPDGRPLRAVFFLEQAAASEVRCLTLADATARLFALTFPPLWEATGVARVLDTCAALAARVPCHVLRFRPDASALAAVRAALA